MGQRESMKAKFKESIKENMPLNWDDTTRDPLI